MDKIVLFDDKQNCCGCGACSVVCPQNTIHMKEDPSGFRYPEIEYANCISCGACKRVCAYQKEGTLFEPRSTYAAATRNTDIMKSASGGIFASFAKWFLEQGGVVYGAILESRNGTLVPLHVGIDRIEALEALQGSKYVQSDLSDVFSAIKRQLHEGRYVLFSGTPCQVDALRSYLGNKAYESLLLIDIICHGVPSARMFQDYIRMLEKKCKGKIVNFTFRDKAYGWGIIGSYEFLRPDGSRMKRKLLLRESSYYSLFNDSHIYRENCYSCPYAGRLRAGDLTIGDYWGIQTAHPEILQEYGGEWDRKKGISCVLVNNKQGERFLHENQENLRLFLSDFSKAAKVNTQLREPAPRSEWREPLLELYRLQGYAGVEKWFRKRNRRELWQIKLKSLIPQGIKDAIRKRK